MLSLAYFLKLTELNMNLTKSSVISFRNFTSITLSDEL